MPDAIFDHPHLAPLYDLFEGPRADLPQYLAICEELEARRVVDIGCGTGALAVQLARTGRNVTGIDPAIESLTIARAKPGADRVTWVRGAATATTLPKADADIVVMSGNVSQVFLTDFEWSATLAAAHRALRPGGHLVFETRRPEAQPWREWQSWEPVTLTVPGLGEYTRTFELNGIHMPFVSFSFVYTLPDGEKVTSVTTLRFRTRREVEMALLGAGFAVEDVRDAEDRPGKEWVFIARRDT